VPIVGDASVSAESSPPQLGQLGRYELISLLAKGGMGEVFLARARGLGGFERLVVVKRNLSTLDPEHQLLFTEARLAATLQHTNIVQVYDVEIDGGTVFIAMEFLHGQDTRHVLERAYRGGGRLPLDQAITIALAVCAGLDYAHDKRDTDGSPLEIVHRDISPSNVFVTYDGGVKLIDFGIAKATTMPSETQLGTVKGKPGYMSPEQCMGEPLDRRSDLFCVGILLYEMTTGRRPFRADNEYKLYKQISEIDPPAPSSLDPSYPPALEAIVQRALAKNRRDRQPTARVLQEELAALASELRLDVSQHALARTMAELFDDELAAWHLAQRTGRSLADHVISRVTGSVLAVEPPASEAIVESPGSTGSVAPVPARSRRVLIAGGAVLVLGAVIGLAVVGARSGGARDVHDAGVTDVDPAAREHEPAIDAAVTDVATGIESPDARITEVAPDTAPVDAAPLDAPRRGDRPPRPRVVVPPDAAVPADAKRAASPAIDATPGIDDPMP